MIDYKCETVLAILRFHHGGLFSDESVVLQSQMSYGRQFAWFGAEDSNASVLDGSVVGRIAGQLILGQKLESDSARLVRNKQGKLFLSGTFIFGQYRIKIPLTECRENRSRSADSFRFGNFDGDRVPGDWELTCMVSGVIENFGDSPYLSISRVREAKVLAWKTIQNSDKFQVQECILLIHFDNPARWVLVNAARNRQSPYDWSEWRQAWVDHKETYWNQIFDHSPTSQEIYQFLEVNWSQDQLGYGYELLDAEVCSNAWKKVTGQLPIKTFNK